MSSAFGTVRTGNQSLLKLFGRGVAVVQDGCRHDGTCRDAGHEEDGRHCQRRTSLSREPGEQTGDHGAILVMRGFCVSIA